MNRHYLKYMCLIEILLNNPLLFLAVSGCGNQTLTSAPVGLERKETYQIMEGVYNIVI